MSENERGVLEAIPPNAAAGAGIVRGGAGAHGTHGARMSRKNAKDLDTSRGSKEAQETKSSSEEKEAHSKMQASSEGLGFADDDDENIISEAHALEQQMAYMQMRLAKIRRRSTTGSGGTSNNSMVTDAAEQKAQQDRQQSSQTESTEHAAEVNPSSASAAASCSTPNGKRTTTEIRAASARSFVHLPPLDSKFKILVVGNAKCGKTSVIQRFTSGSFTDNYKTTIGADFTKKLMDWGKMGGDTNVAKNVKLQMWDIAGQDRFARLTRAYFNAAKGALVVCDVTRAGTFEAAAEWKRELDRVLTTYEENDGVKRATKIPCILIANKADLLSDVASSFVAGAKMEQMCRQHGFAGWFVTSAKSGENVEAAMCFLTRQMLAQRDLQRARAAGGGKINFGGKPKLQQPNKIPHKHRDGAYSDKHHYGGFVKQTGTTSSGNARSESQGASAAQASGSARLRAYYQAETEDDATRELGLMYETLPHARAKETQLRVRGSRRADTQKKKKSSCC